MGKNKFISLLVVFTGVILFCVSILFQVHNERCKMIERNEFPIEICANEKSIYYIGKIFDNNGVNTYGLYEMDIETFEIEEIFMEKEESVVVKKLAIAQEDLYLLVNNIEGYEIWKFENETGITCMCKLSEIDNIVVSDIGAFCVDEQGVCYIRETSGTETILLNLKSGQVIKIQDSSKDIYFESMAIGVNGNIFALFCRSLKIGGGYEVVEFVDTKREVVYCGELLPYDDIYSVMGTGNEEFDIFIKGSKMVYGFSKENQNVETITGISLDKYRYTKSCFLRKGRLLIFGMNPKDGKDNTINQTNILSLQLKRSRR